jgi:hypothetical protein
MDTRARIYRPIFRENKPKTGSINSGTGKVLKFLKIEAENNFVELMAKPVRKKGVFRRRICELGVIISFSFIFFVLSFLNALPFFFHVCRTAFFPLFLYTSVFHLIIPSDRLVINIWKTISRVDILLVFQYFIILDIFYILFLFSEELQNFK